MKFTHSPLRRSLCGILAVTLALGPTLAQADMEYRVYYGGGASANTGGGTTPPGGNGNGGNGNSTLDPGNNPGGGGTGGTGGSGSTPPDTGSGTGNGGTPAATAVLHASASLLDFGTVVSGDSMTRSLTVSNTGTVTATGLAVSAGGAFGASSDCGATLAVGASCSVTVQFSATPSGAYTQNLSVTASNSAAASTLLTATIAAPHAPTAASLAFTPASLTFPAQTANTSTLLSTTLTNSGTAAANLSGIGFLAGAGVFGQSNDCGTELAIGASCQVNIAFTPTGAADYAGSLQVVTATGAPVQLPLSGRGSAAVLAVEPASVSFGNVAVSGSSTLLQVSVKNNGNTPATELALSVSGSTFSLSGSTCGTSLAAAGVCSVSVAFTPTQAGSQTGSLSVQAGNAPALSVTLSGTATQAAVSASPTTISFADTAVNSSASALSVVFSNTGNSAANITGLSIVNGSGTFGQSNNCGTSLAAGAACTANVLFTPAQSGPLTGTLSLVVAGLPSVNVALSGKGLQAVLDVSPTSVDFGTLGADGSSFDRTLTLTNSGNTPAVSVSAQLSGAASFALASNTCGSSLAAGASCALVARYTPTAAVHTQQSASVSMTASNAASRTATLTGHSAPSVLAWSASSLTFAKADVGASSAVQTVTLTNSSGTFATLQGLGLVSGQSDFAQSNNCGSGLAAGASCTVSVQMTPSKGGALSGTLAVVTPDQALSVTLTGSGATGASAVSEPGGTTPGDGFTHYTIAFADTPMAQSSTVRNITLGNNGDGFLTVQGISQISGGSDFGMTNNCGSGLAPGATCVISLQFTPAALGGRTGAVAIQTSSYNYVLDLTGNGVYPVPSLSPTAYGTFTPYTAQTLAITGHNLQYVNSVKVNGVSLTITAQTATTLSATLPASFDESVTTLTIANVYGYSATGSVQFKYPALSVDTAVSPATVRQGSSTTLTVVATNVFSAPVLTMAGRSFPATLNASTVTVPLSNLVTAGTYPVTLSAVGSRQAAAGSLTVVAPLSVTSVSPNATTYVPTPQTFTFTGTGFQATDTVKLVISGQTVVATNVTRVSDTQLTADVQVPPLAGTATLTVTSGLDATTASTTVTLGKMGTLSYTDSVSTLTALRWADSTYSGTCAAYLAGDANHAAQTTSGVYWLMATGTPTAAYCDMATDGGGWTLVMRAKGQDVAGWSTTGALNTARGAVGGAPTGGTFKYSDADINALRGAGIYRLRSDGTVNVTRFVAAHAYAHQTRRTTANTPATVTYTTAALTGAFSGVTAALNGSYAYYGIADDQGASKAYFDTNFVSNDWILGNGVGTLCHGNASVNCSMSMWVR